MTLSKLTRPNAVDNPLDKHGDPKPGLEQCEWCEFYFSEDDMREGPDGCAVCDACWEQAFELLTKHIRGTLTLTQRAAVEAVRDEMRGVAPGPVGSTLFSGFIADLTAALAATPAPEPAGLRAKVEAVRDELDVWIKALAKSYKRGERVVMTLETMNKVTGIFNQIAAALDAAPGEPMVSMSTTEKAIETAMKFTIKNARIEGMEAAEIRKNTAKFLYITFTNIIHANLAKPTAVAPGEPRKCAVCGNDIDTVRYVCYPCVQFAAAMGKEPVVPVRVVNKAVVKASHLIRPEALDAFRGIFYIALAPHRAAPEPEPQEPMVPVRLIENIISQYDVWDRVPIAELRKAIAPYRQPAAPCPTCGEMHYTVGCAGDIGKIFPCPVCANPPADPLPIELCVRCGLHPAKECFSICEYCMEDTDYKQATNPPPLDTATRARWFVENYCQGDGSFTTFLASTLAGYSDKSIRAWLDAQGGGDDAQTT